MGIKSRDLRGGAGAGLVEVEVDDAGQVVLSLHPPRRDPVVLPMDPEQAFELAKGLIDGVDEATGHRADRDSCPYCAQSLIVTGVPDGS